MTARIIAFCALFVAGTPLCPSQQFVEQSGPCLMPAREYDSTCLAAGDVDGDGDVDHVVGVLGERNALLINDGTGRFVDFSQNIAALPAADTSGIALGDVDLDGDLDFVTANNSTSRGFPNRLFLNDGAGRFTAATFPADTVLSSDVVLGDVDGDGDLDALFANRSAQSSLLINDGTGSFVDDTTNRLPIEQWSTTSAQLGDVDNDGDPDIVLGNLFAPHLLFLNDGNGYFSDVTSTHMPTSRNDTWDVTLVDVDGDGDLDLVAAKGPGWQNTLYINDGLGYYSDGTSTRLPVAPDDSYCVAAADIDGDGDSDLVFGNGDTDDKTNNTIYLNDGYGFFTAAPPGTLPADGGFTWELVFADVDGNGHPDLIVGNRRNGAVRYRNLVYLNTGTGRFVETCRPRIGTGRGIYARAIALVDVDGDGDRDLLVGTGVSRNRLFFNDGAGFFEDVSDSQLPSARTDTGALAVGDVDGDGSPDFFAGNGIWGREQNRLYLNDGTGAFTESPAGHVPANFDITKGADLADVDADGDLDLILANGGGTNAQNRLYLNDGSGVFQDVTMTRMPSDSDDTRAVVAIDLDLDLDPDLLFASAQGLKLYLNAAGSFSSYTATHIPALPGEHFALAVGDVDGDGDLDVAVANDDLQGAQNFLLINDGTGVFTDGTGRLPARMDHSTAVVFADLDLDRDLDLVFGGPSDGTSAESRVYFNDGTGRFTDVTSVRTSFTGQYTRAVRVGDVDGDADPDIVFGNSSNASRVYVDLHRQIEIPRLPYRAQSLVLQSWTEPGYGTTPRIAIPALSFRLANPPIQLPPYGTLHLVQSSLLLGPWMSVPPTTTGSELHIPVPNNPVLVGSNIYVQALFVDSVGIAAHLSNFTGTTIL